jgi:hypothetical protein
MSIAGFVFRIIFFLAGAFFTKLAVEAMIAGQISSRGLTWTYKEDPIGFCIDILVRLLPGLLFLFASIAKWRPVDTSIDEQKLK